MKGPETTEHSAGMVVYRAGKTPEYLLLWHGGSYWNFPKGRLEQGEGLQAAALREVAEEAGLSGLSLHPAFTETIHYTFSHIGRKILKEVTFFLGRVDGGEVRISHEHEGFGWFSYSRAMKLLAYPESRSVLESAHETLNAEELRASGA